MNSSIVLGNNLYNTRISMGVYLYFILYSIYNTVKYCVLMRVKMNGKKNCRRKKHAVLFTKVTERNHFKQERKNAKEKYRIVGYAEKNEE